MEIMIRKTAKANNLSTYFTGEPCKHGHIARRFTASGTCCQCHENHQRGERSAAKGFRHYLEQFGVVDLIVAAHPDDFPVIKELAKALVGAREEKYLREVARPQMAADRAAGLNRFAMGTGLNDGGAATTARLDTMRSRDGG